MTTFLKTNTATRITVGPFLDKTDGVTPEVALTVTNCHLTLMVDTGGVPTLVIDAAPTASGGNNDMVHVTGDDAGYYDLELTAAQLNYVGNAKLAITDAANHCPVFHELVILPAQVYDSLIAGSDLLDANASQLGGTAQTGRDVGLSVLLAADQAVNVTKVNGTAQTARDLGAQLDVAVSTRGTGTALDAAGVRGAVGLAAANLDAQLTAANNGTPPTAAAIADAVLDEGLAGHAIAGSAGAALSAANTVAPDNATIAAIAAAVAALNDLTAAEVGDAVLDEAVEGIITLRQMVRLFAAALHGKLSGAATNTIRIRDVADTKDRIVATVDADGNRTAVTLDAS